MRKPRKNYTPVEKVAILRRQLIDRVPISDLCDEHQLSTTLFCLWQKQFFENGTAAFEPKKATSESRHVRAIAALRDKLQRKNEVVAELMEEQIKLRSYLPPVGVRFSTGRHASRPLRWPSPLARAKIARRSGARAVCRSVASQIGREACDA